MTDFLKGANIKNNKARGSCSIATINGAQSFAALKLSRSTKKLYSSGAYYIGNLLGTQRDGWGKLNWSLGCEHEGYYCKNKRNGKGTTTWKDGSFYNGDFKNDLRHGNGKISFPNGEVGISMYFHTFILKNITFVLEIKKNFILLISSPDIYRLICKT